MYKKIVSLAAVSVTVGSLFVSATVAFAAGTNLVNNGNLEAGAANAPTGWSQDYWGTLTPTFTYPVAGNGGGKAAQIKLTAHTNGDAKWVFAHVPVTAGTTYTFSEDYLSSVATEIDIEYKSSSGAYSYVSLASPASSANVWKNFSTTITPPSGVVSMTVMHIIEAVGSLAVDNVSLASNTATTTPPPPPPATTTPAVPTITAFTAAPSAITAGQISTLSWSTANATSLLLSDGTTQTTVTGTSKAVSPAATTTYTLTALNGGSATTSKQLVVTVSPVVATTTPPPPPPPPAPTNLVKNGTLEAGTTNAPTNWHADYWGTLTPTFTYPVVGKGGGKAAKLVVTNWKSGDVKWWFDHVAVSSNTLYTFTDDYISNVISNITVEFKMSNGTYQYQWVANAPAASTWTTLSVQITVPRGAVSMTVLHALDKNGTLTIDNASLTAQTANPFATGMVTLAFDDGLKSQFTNARPILNTAGIKAGYYIITTEPASGDTAYMTWANIKTLKTEGNEVGGHTRTHPDLTAITSAAAQTEIKGSYSDLAAQGLTPKAFVYPVGGVSPAVEQLVKAAGYTVARGSYWGMNSPATDDYALYDIRLDKTTTLAQAKAWIDQAVADKRWLVLELHDVLPSGGDDYAVSTSLFQSIVSYIKTSGIKPVTLEQGRANMHP
jgi:peptidoglycan/xylan/chitin deacetylase (PgdA/CDA1 family)